MQAITRHGMTRRVHVYYYAGFLAKLFPVVDLDLRNYGTIRNACSSDQKHSLSDTGITIYLAMELFGKNENIKENDCSVKPGFILLKYRGRTKKNNITGLRISSTYHHIVRVPWMTTR